MVMSYDSKEHNIALIPCKNHNVCSRALNNEINEQITERCASANRFHRNNISDTIALYVASVHQ